MGEERITSKRILVFKPPDRLELDVFERRKWLEVRCSVLGCDPTPEITLMVNRRAVSTSNETSVVSSKLSLTDSAAIQCKVAIHGTNYTNSVEHEYIRRTETFARPLISDTSSNDAKRSLIMILLILLMI